MEGKWLFYGILGSIVLATNAWALVPDRTATVTALAIGTAKCGGIASAKIDGMYTNDSLKLMGLTSGIQITTDTYYNRELTYNTSAHQEFSSDQFLHQPSPEQHVHQNRAS